MKTFLFDNWDKFDLIHAPGRSSSRVDTAIPQSLSDELRRLQVDAWQFMYSYEKRDGKTCFGRPISLGELMVELLLGGKYAMVPLQKYYAGFMAMERLSMIEREGLHRDAQKVLKLERRGEEG